MEKLPPHFGNFSIIISNRFIQTNKGNLHHQILSEGNSSKYNLAIANLRNVLYGLRKDD